MKRIALIGTHSALWGLWALADLQAANIGGTVYDPSGGVVPQALITLSNPVTGEKQSSTSNPVGAFTFANLVAGQYLLQTDKAGFASLYKVVTLDVDSDLHPVVVLSIGRLQETVAVRAKGTPAMGPNGGPKRIRVGGNVQAANLIQKVQPAYPQSQKAQGVQGTVSIAADISREGVPVELTVLTTPSEELANSALEAVRQWRYRPTLLNGEPVEVTTQVDVNYTLAP